MVAVEFNGMVAQVTQGSFVGLLVWNLSRRMVAELLKLCLLLFLGSVVGFYKTLALSNCKL